MDSDDVGRGPFGQRVKELREQAGMSQAQLASALQTTTMRVYRIERGEVSAKLELIQELAEKLKVTPIEFLAPLLGSDPAALEAVTEERLEEERRLRVQQFLETLDRPALTRWVQEAERAGEVMTDDELELLMQMLNAWRFRIGMARFVDAGVRARLKERAPKPRRKR